MRAPSGRRWLQWGGWLLTPVVAWAVAFLGGWLGAVVGARLRGPTAGLGAIVVGALAGATLGVVGWMRVMRRTRVARGSEPPPAADDESSG